MSNLTAVEDWRRAEVAKGEAVDEFLDKVGND